MSGDVDSFGEFAATQNLDAVLAGDESILLEHVEIEVGDILGFSEGVEGVDVDADIFNTVDILETEFRDTAIEGHLTTLEANFLMVAGTSLGTLVTACGSAALAGAGAATDTFGVLDRTFSRFEIT